MIIRQFCARHGRTVVCRSSRSVCRTYATDSSRPPQEQRPMRIAGHPDDPSSILDTIPIQPTPRTRRISEEIDKLESATKTLRSETNAHIAAKVGGIVALDADLSVEEDVAVAEEISEKKPTQKAPFKNVKSFNKFRSGTQELARTGSNVVDAYDPYDLLYDPPSPKDLTLPMLLANQTHLGHHTSLWNPANSSYIFGVRDGIHIISLDTTYAYLQRAAKVVREVARRGGIILFIGTRKGQTDIVVRSARKAKAYHIFNRWVPGSLTNGQQILGNCAIKVVNLKDEALSQYDKQIAALPHAVLRPDLVVVLNPMENEVCLHECGIYNVPTIGIIDTDANPNWVTYPIPANDDSMRSVGLIAGVLANASREGQMLRRKAAMENGEATYSTQPAKIMLADLEGMAEIDVKDANA